MKRICLVIFPCFAIALLICVRALADEEQPDRHEAALKVIERNLDVAGGEKALRTIRCLRITGGQGHKLTIPSLHTDFFLTNDGCFKRVSGTEVILCSGDRFGITRAPARDDARKGSVKEDSENKRHAE